MNLETMTDEQFAKLLEVEDRRLGLEERQLQARELEVKSRAALDEERQAAWEKHAAAIEEHSKITHQMLGRIADALEAAVPMERG